MFKLRNKVIDLAKFKKYDIFLVLCLFKSGKKEVLIRRLKNHHKQECLNKKVESDYDYVCVIDYEATCTESAANFNYPHEIIEFPIVLCNLKTLTIVRVLVKTSSSSDRNFTYNCFLILRMPIFKRTADQRSIQSLQAFANN